MRLCVSELAGLASMCIASQALSEPSDSGAPQNHRQSRSPAQSAVTLRALMAPKVPVPVMDIRIVFMPMQHRLMLMRMHMRLHTIHDELTIKK